MELDEMKSAWQRLDQRLERQEALHFRLFKDGRLERARFGLRHLLLGQQVQIIAGVLLMVWVAPYWVEHRSELHRLVPGALLHAYGLMLVLFAARTLHLIQRIDYASPVVLIQSQLVRLRAWVVRCGLWFAIVGCFIWTPLLMVTFDVLGADVWVRRPQVVGWWLASSVVCLGLSYGLWWCSRRPGWGRLAKFLDDGAVGRSIRGAQRELDEIARFNEP